MKKQLITALLGMLMISILPGCGKKKNDAAINSSGVYGNYNGQIGANGCISVYGYYNSGLSLAFSGQSTSLTGVTGNLRISSGGIPGGYNVYTRQNYINGQPGDSLSLVNANGAVYAQASLSYSTISWVNQYAGGQICGLSLNTNLLQQSVQGGSSQFYWTGTIGGGTVALITPGGLLQL